MKEEGTRQERAVRAYRNLFSIEEFEESFVLQWAFGVLLVGFLMLANTLIEAHTITVQGVLDGSFVCWPWFPNCADWHFLVGYPEGYSQRLAFALVLGLLVACAHSIWKKDWTVAHALLLVVYLFYVFVIYVLEGRGELKYGDNLMVLATVALFFKNKVFYLGLTMVMMYFFGGISKLNEGWIMGTRFLGTETLPLIPRSATMFATNVVLVMELLGSWLLLSRAAAVRVPVLFFFLVLHVYIVMFTELTYAVIALPLLLLLFSNSSIERRPQRLQWGAVCFLGALFVLQLIHFLIPGNVIETREGDMYTFRSFAADFECRSIETHIFSDGTTQEFVRTSAGTGIPCYPYAQLFAIRRRCELAGVLAARIAWKFDLYINGAPYLRIVDAPNACVLTFNAFAHNDWIQLHPEVIEITKNN